MTPMRFLVVGTGSVGTRHCRNLAALGHAVMAWDADPARLDEVSDEPGVEIAGSLNDALGAKPDAALICTPPSSHVRIAREALDSGAHLFIEKPLAVTTSDALPLVVEAERHRRILAVGFNLRFLPSLRRVKTLLDDKRVGRVLVVRAEFGSYLPDWRPGRDYRLNYAVSSELGGGILLDAIHELDYLTWFFDDVSEVSGTVEHKSRLAGDTEDLAEITLRFKSGVLAQVHLDYFQRTYHRTLKVIGDAGTILWDFSEQTVTVLALDAAPEAMKALDGDRNQMYVDELRHFVRCLEGSESPIVDGREALRSLRLVDAVKRSAGRDRWERV
jgi:predicted dehydrogenase